MTNVSNVFFRCSKAYTTKSDLLSKQKPMFNSFNVLKLKNVYLYWKFVEKKVKKAVIENHVSNSFNNSLLSIDLLLQIQDFVVCKFKDRSVEIFGNRICQNHKFNISLIESYFDSSISRRSYRIKSSFKTFMHRRCRHQEEIASQHEKHYTNARTLIDVKKLAKMKKLASKTSMQT